jgi:DNA repair exonuclease SbcCD nuclease subunit
VEHAKEIFCAIDRLVRQENADMVISGGDLTDNGSAEEISMVVELAKENLSVPLYLALGNHDCMQEDCTGVWLKNAPEFFPDGKADTTIIRDGVRVDILSLLWGREDRTWHHSEGAFTRLSDEQYELLRKGEQDLPRILVMHCQLAPARPEQTGLEEDLMAPENNFAAAGKALINEFHPKLVLSGHIHINLLDQIDGTFAAAVSSTAETPFDCKVVEITEKKVTMRTVPLAPELGFEPEYWEERKYVQGDKNIREFEA